MLSLDFRVQRDSFILLKINNKSRDEGQVHIAIPSLNFPHRGIFWSNGKREKAQVAAGEADISDETCRGHRVPTILSNHKGLFYFSLKIPSVFPLSRNISLNIEMKRENGVSVI